MSGEWRNQKDPKTKARLADKYKKKYPKTSKKAKNRGTLSDQTDSVGDLYRKYGMKK
jgi:hypothetical protein